jgi:cell division septal protein FtsQ
MSVQPKVRPSVLYRRAGLAFAGLCLLVLFSLAAHLATQKLMHVVFYESGVFSLQNIDVRTKQGVVSKSEVVRWTGLETGVSILEVNLDSVRRRLEKMPNVASVTVERSFPSTILISIEERQPIARIMPVSPQGNKLAQGVYYVDGDGFVMKPKEGERLRPLPMITGVSVDEVADGSRTDRPEVLSALELIKLSEYSAVRSDLDLNQLEVQRRGYLLVRTQNEGLIRFRTDVLPQQMQRLEVILGYAREHGRVVRTADLTPERNVPVTFF